MPLPCEQLQRAAALAGHEGVGAGGLHQRHPLDGQDEHGAPHAERAHQAPVVVEGALDGGGARLAHAGRRRQEHGRRVRGVQRDQVVGDGHHVVGPRRRCQVVAPRQPGPPLGDGDAAHARTVPWRAGGAGDHLRARPSPSTGPTWGGERLDQPEPGPVGGRGPRLRGRRAAGLHRGAGVGDLAHPRARGRPAARRRRCRHPSSSAAARATSRRGCADRGARAVGLDPTAAQLATARMLQDEIGPTFPLVRAAAEQVPCATPPSTS
jgi:hypothetical protein